jgi:hypothetical protein
MILSTYIETHLREQIRYNTLSGDAIGEPPIVTMCDLNLISGLLLRAKKRDTERKHKGIDSSPIYPSNGSTDNNVNVNVTTQLGVLLTASPGRSLP